MRRFALLGLPLLLTACDHYAGSPFVGFGGFVGDTATFTLNPNRPVGDAPNLLRAEGKTVELEPLTPEPGNVWPGPAAPEPTLLDIQRNEPAFDNSGQPVAPHPAPPRGSSAPPGPPGALPPPPPLTQPPAAPRNAPPSPPSSQMYPVPGGAPAIGNQMGNGVQTFTAPNGGVGIIVPNGNGTSTLIAPNGSVSTVPNPR